MKKIYAVAFLMVVFSIAHSVRADDAGIEAAKALFKSYVALEQAFNPGVADLYADSAVIKNKRIYPSGQVKELSLPAATYKDLIRKSMPLARQKGDLNEYSEVKYVKEGNYIRISAMRLSKLKQYKSPLSLLVGRSGKGTWLIYEELSESRP
ncbi:MAG: hypothetical protein RDV48_17735 [Candidatus Eremiobacteraeota bacterium]|nr:hypothetical protein [Candidatus Eremiobacteraeota bacterium]